MAYAAQKRKDASPIPEGDALARVAARLAPLVGQRIDVVALDPRARVAERLDGRRLEAARSVGKNLLLEFEGGLVLRSHLRMKGRWRVLPRGARLYGRPWLVLRGESAEAVLWHGPVLELGSRGVERLGPDILADPPDLDAILAGLRSEGQRRELGDALLDQGVVAGIGNVWKAESLWEARLSPWVALGDVGDAELRSLLEGCSRLMRRSAAGERLPRRVYRRAGRPCPRCGEAIRSRGQGDANRTAYWCPRCQPTGRAGGETAPSA
jgi:endonuclease VIII